MSGKMRLLPWQGPDGKPCYLSADESGGGYLSRLADEVEEAQLDTGEEMLELSGKLLQGPDATSADELRFCVHRLREALRDALRIARTR
ncbi:hypothetical protein AB0C96_00460 [Streptomyces sp. NPDC048506]|uniref:hypothetical protein n=1 Tax=Streptomyces sp. NPDC048506 TaxID=3155028 RepID=UPI003428546D